MIREAWAAYARRSWGHGELDYRRGSYGLFGRNSGYTIVTSMSTLWAAGLKEEFEAGRKWITRSLSNSFASISSSVEVSRVVSGYIGGLLSCYALTKEVLFLERAVEIGLLLEPAYAGTKGKRETDVFETPFLKLPSFNFFRRSSSQVHRPQGWLRFGDQGAHLRRGRWTSRVRLPGGGERG